MPDWYIARSRQHPGKLAVWEIPESGPHVVVADELQSVEEAMRWINFNTKAPPQNS